MLTLHRLLPDDIEGAARWDAFVLAAPTATFYHRAGWQRVIGRVYGHRCYFLYAERDGQIEGVLPLAHLDSFLFGNALMSLAFCAYGGVAATTPEAADALETEAQRIAWRLGVDHLELRNIAPRHPDWPTQDLYATFRRDILPEEEANLLAIPRKQRAMVRKGINNGLASEIDGHVERFYALYADNMHRHGSPVYPKSHFQCLMDEFGPDAQVLTVVDADGLPVSSVFSFYFRGEVLPVQAGDNLAARDLAANDFKYWELLRRACTRGLKVFDFGRSKRGTGAYDFKKNWGFEPQPLHYEYRLYRREAIPQNNPANPKYRLFIDAWRRLPFAMATWLGPYIVRNLG